MNLSSISIIPEKKELYYKYKRIVSELVNRFSSMLTKQVKGLSPSVIQELFWKTVDGYPFIVNNEFNSIYKEIVDVIGYSVSFDIISRERKIPREFWTLYNDFYCYCIGRTNQPSKLNLSVLEELYKISPTPNMRQIYNEILTSCKPNEEILRDETQPIADRITAFKAIYIPRI